MQTRSTTPGFWPAAAWCARVVAIVALLGIAVWWSSTANFAGEGYCETHPVDGCDMFGGEKLAPYVLWPLTWFACFLVTVVAMLSAPTPSRERLVWAAMIGSSVFVANRNNPLWATLTAGLAFWLVKSADQDSRPPSAGLLRRDKVA